MHLQNFTGTVVFVSHDRYFIDNLATRIFEIESGHVEVFPGNYDDYLWRKQGKPEATRGPPALANGAKPSSACRRHRKAQASQSLRLNPNRSASIPSS